MEAHDSGSVGGVCAGSGLSPGWRDCRASHGKQCTPLTHCFPSPTPCGASACLLVRRSHDQHPRPTCRGASARSGRLSSDVAHAARTRPGASPTDGVEQRWRGPNCPHPSTGVRICSPSYVLTFPGPSRAPHGEVVANSSGGGRRPCAWSSSGPNEVRDGSHAMPANKVLTMYTPPPCRCGNFTACFWRAHGVTSCVHSSIDSLYFHCSMFMY